MNIKPTGVKMEGILFKFTPLLLIVLSSFVIVVSVATWFLFDAFDFLLLAFLMAAFMFSFIGMCKFLELRSLKRFKRAIVFTSLSFSAPAAVLFFTSDIWFMFLALFVSAFLALMLYEAISCFRRIPKEQENQDHNHGIGNIN